MMSLINLVSYISLKCIFYEIKTDFISNSKATNILAIDDCSDIRLSLALLLEDYGLLSLKRLTDRSLK
ncbi:MAG TPA: hypothetical protein DIS98_07370 [Colwellia sp.]|nr:hypothetical protein [Colwellia sp.]